MDMSKKEMHGKTVMKGTRVKSAGVGNTPIAGSPQKKDATMKGNRVKVAPALPRKNDPPKKAQDRMGLKIGARVTRETRKG